MKKHWSSISGLPIMLPDEERPLGYLKGAFMDPEKAQLIGFLAGYTKILVPVEIEKWRQDAVQVSSPEAVSPILDILRIEKYGLRRTFLNGKRVLTKSGKNVGQVRDFTFDPMTLYMATFEVSKRLLWLEWDKRIFSSKDIEEVTPKAIILNTELEKTVKSGKTVNLPAVTGA
ncbi:hypothetical protein A3J23_01395 [Candidatus Peregrinibacteria bacterium RIFCSPLOWO2_02_FULL_48_14]|nr:MAG: hypothetical protein A3J23_01395 [Candidatus Peregrinibacteria bacterium RIFCSPLOWO2_02_FULL_48_14]